MNVQEAILTRRSIRAFKDDPVDLTLVNELIKCAIYAPSSGNKQGWKFIIVTDKSIKEFLCDHNGCAMSSGRNIIKESPCGILVLYRNDISKNSRIYHDHIQSAAG